MKMLPKFEIDAAGFAELQEAREPWTLAREPISNSFDEASVTRVTVTLTKEGNRPAVLVVEDDGPGFADLKDAYTLYAYTYKRADSLTRGRFNRGEKELFSVADRGSIMTTCGSVHFDGNLRSIGRKKMERGTRVEVELKWTHAEVEEILRHLRTFIPPDGKTYVVNGVEVHPRQPEFKIPAKLENILKTDGSLRRVTRGTVIHVHRIRKGEEAVLMEMGIPVVSLIESDVPFLLDIQQKVPMSPERDSVRPGYLRDVLAEVLNGTAEILSEKEVCAKWVNTALPDDRVTEDVVRAIKEKRVGKALIMNPFDPHANEQAAAEGLDYVSTKGWDSAVVDRFKVDAGWKSTSQAFPKPAPGAGTPVSTPGTERTRHFIEAVAQARSMRIPQVCFENLPNAWAAADCGGNTITFYVNMTGEAMYDSPNENLLALVTHEMGHLGQDGSNAHTTHDSAWGDRALMILAYVTLHPDLLDVLKG